MKVSELKNSNQSMDQRPVQYVNWLELSVSFVCWIGIAGLIFLISQSGRAEQSGFLPGARSFNPFSNSASPSRGAPSHLGKPGNPGNPNFYDDDDEDDLDDDYPSPLHRSMSRSNHGPADHRNPARPNDRHSLGQNSNLHSPFPGRDSRDTGRFSRDREKDTSSSSRSYSAGGATSLGTTPIFTDKGISIGGQSSNGIINGNKAGPLKVNDETGEGSKEIITDFNFPDADILDIAKTLSKLTGKNLVVDKDVKGKITIISNSPITVSDAWKAFLTALNINGLAIVPSGKFLRIARERDARDKQLKTFTGDYSPDTDALITRVFPLKYISSEEVARTFRSFMPAGARIIPYEQTNTVIVTDTGSNIAKLAKMLEILDVEGYDAGIEVVPVKYASAVELSKLIDALIPGTSTPAAGGGGGGGLARFGGGASGRFSARRTKEGGIINTIIADERTNTLIVHANSKGADQVRSLVSTLDQKNPATTGGGKVHVVYLQFADAEQISNTLNNFSSQSAAKPAGAAPAAGGPTGGTGVNPTAGALFEGAIKISADKATNSLVINASPADFVTVQRVINRLDIPRDQVYVEVVIMEVAINKGFEFSSNVAAPTSGVGSIVNGDLGSFLQNPLASTGALIGYQAFGNSTVQMNGQSIKIGNLQGLVRAIQSHTNSDILATPQIIALDNTEATFESAEKIPVNNSQTTATGVISNNITKEPVALSIKLTPQINKVTNFVKMNVAAKLSDIQNTNVPSALQNQAFGTLERTASTTVIVGDSDTVVLGGLIRSKSEDTVNKIPILGDIPLLGWLFRSKITKSLKSNLVILMTPHIVRQYEKVRTILDQKLKERDDFLESHTSGEDPQRWKRDEVIRSLPDLKEIINNHPPSTISIDGDEAEKTPPAAVVVPPNQGTPPTPAPVPSSAPDSSTPGSSAPLTAIPEATMVPAPAGGAAVGGGG